MMGGFVLSMYQIVVIGRAMGATSSAMRVAGAAKGSTQTCMGLLREPLFVVFVLRNVQSAWRACPNSSTCFSRDGHGEKPLGANHGMYATSNILYGRIANTWWVPKTGLFRSLGR